MPDKITVEYEASLKKLEADLAKLEARFGHVETTAKKSAKGVEDNFEKAGKGISTLDSQISGLATKLAGVFAVDRLIAFASSVFKVTAEFQKFEAVLTNSLGSKSAAKAALTEITEFAKKTPFSVQELTASFVKLVNQGFKPTSEEMRKLGDLASSTGKSFDMLTEAIIDAQTGEFERLKEFGIRAQKEGDKVSFTFKGVKTQTDFTNESIRKYILSLGDLQGVSGGMAAISQTLGGQVSNLGDAYDSLLLSLGKISGGGASDFIGAMQRIISSVQGFIDPSVSARDELVLIQEQFNREIEVLTKANYTQEQRAKAIRDINEKYGEYLPNLISEKASIEDIAKAQRGMNDLLMEKIIIMDFEKELAEIYKLQKESAESLYQTEKKRTELKTDASGNAGAQQLEIQNKQLNDLDKINNKVLDVTNEQAKNIDDKYNAIAKTFGLNWDKIRKKINDAKKEDEKALSSGKASDPFAPYKKALDENLFKEFSGQAKESNDEIVLSAQNAADLQLQIYGDMGEEISDEKAHQLNRNALYAQQKYDEDVEATRQAEDKKRYIRQVALQTTQNMINDLFAFQQDKLQIETQNALKANQAQTDDKLSSLEKQKEGGLISERQFNDQKNKIQKESAKKEFELKLQAAKEEKQLQIFNIAINALANAVKVFPNPYLIAAAVAQGALAAGLVAARPLPKAEKGGKLKGKRHSQGGIVIEAEHEEFIVNRVDSNKNDELLRAINTGKGDKYIEEKRVIPALKAAAKRREAQIQKDMAHNIYEAMKLQAFDDSNITRAIKRNKSVALENVDQLGKAFAKYSDNSLHNQYRA